jgi:hypothetical protein
MAAVWAHCVGSWSERFPGCMPSVGYGAALTALPRFKRRSCVWVVLFLFAVLGLITSFFPNALRQGPVCGAALYSKQCVPCVMAPPARKAAATMIVSAISVSVQPAFFAFFVWISMQYGH